MTDPTPEQVVGFMSHLRYRPSRLLWWRVRREAARLRSTAADDAEKNLLWGVETYCSAELHYLDAFRKMAREDFYGAWCLLERAEIDLLFLIENCSGELRRMALWLRDIIEAWQDTFPYTLFFSPEMIIKAWRCSICGEVVDHATPCGHLAGTVYSGVLCTQAITDFEARGVSIVTNPVQKYSVIFPQGKVYDYALPAYIASLLQHAHHPWRGEWGWRDQEHWRFEDVDSGDFCPCRSGLRYGECCLKRGGVRLPHYQVKVAGGFSGPDFVFVTKRDAPQENRPEP